jgi:CheY-like chemotaxis protein
MSSILLVYERDQDLSALETLLQSRGHHLAKARTGLEALELARNDTPHAVVSDVLLPLLDGFALCRRLKEDPATQYLPVFLLSFRVEGPKYEAFAAEVGAQRFFPRGSTLEELATAIDGLKTHSDTMRIPALVPELLDRQQHDRRQVADLERQIRELQYTNKLLAAAERAARSKIDRDAKDRESQAVTESDNTRELQQRVDELEARLKEQAAAESQAKDAAEQVRASSARAEALESRLEELQSSCATAQAAATDAERAFGAQPLPTLLSDMESHEIRAASDSAAALLGVAPKELSGRSLKDLLPGCVPGDDKVFPRDVNVVMPDGTHVVLRQQRTSVSFTGRACWLTTLVDVTAEHELRETQRLAQARAAALDASPVATCLVDEHGQLTHANPAFGVLMSLDNDSIDGAALAGFEAREGGSSPASQAAVDTGDAPRLTRWRRPDGSSFDAEVSSAALPDLPGARIVTVRDVTDSRRAGDRTDRERQLHEGLLDLAQHTHMLTETEVPARALELVRRLTGSEQGYVFLATPDVAHLELAARSTAAADAGQALPVRWRGKPPTESALMECLKSLQVAHREAAEGTGVLRQAGLPASLERQMATPILDGGRLVGVLLTSRRRSTKRIATAQHRSRMRCGRRCAAGVQTPRSSVPWITWSA